jgi:hypothetical protein
MKKDVHYGVIKGCGDKPTLLKPGAEKIMVTFGLSARPTVEDLSTSDCMRYRVTVTLISASGIDKGAGIGECSSDEEKYKWRKAIGKEFDEAMEDRRRLKWRRGYGGNPDYQEQQIMTNPADLANTILKMSKKRALVDAVLTATAASDCFSQDVEDLPEEYIDQKETKTKPVTTTPQEKPKGEVKMSSKAQQTAIHKMAGKAFGSQEELTQMMIEKYHTDSTEKLTIGQASEVFEWLSKTIKENEKDNE